MISKKKISIWAIAIFVSTSAVAADFVNVPDLTSTQIVEKNIAARGGLEAWQKIQSMVWVGHIESGKASSQSMPFVLEMKRPNKTRFEVKSQSQTSVRMFDGNTGWKLLPASNGKPEMHPYRSDELNFAREGQGIDGLLMDYKTKGFQVALDGVDSIEGRNAYRLIIKLPSGNSHRLWIDAKTFLDIKDDHLFRNLSGQTNSVSVIYRDYKTVEGVQVPFMIESGTDSAKGTEKLILDKVLLNPPLADQLFTKPKENGWHSKASVDIQSQNPLRQTARPERTMPGSGGG